MAEVRRSFELAENSGFVLRVRSRNRVGQPSEWSETLALNTISNTTPMSGPLNLIVSPAIRSIILTWDPNTEKNFDHYEIYVSSATFGVADPDPMFKYGDFSSTIATIKKVFEPAGATPGMNDLFPGTRYYMKMRAVSTSGVFSPFSAEVTTKTGFVNNNDFTFGSITGDKIQVNSLAADRITTGTLTADKISTGTLFADVTVSGSIKTGNSGARVELNPSGIKGYDVNGADPNFIYNTSDGTITIRQTRLTGGSEILSPANASNFDTNTLGWVAQRSATTWQFDSTTSSWTGSSATLTWEGTFVYNPPGSVKVTATGAVYEARSPSGVSGVPTTPGNRHRVILPILAVTGPRAMQPCLRWWKSGGTASTVKAESTGAVITTDLVEWRIGIVDDVAPSDAAFVSCAYKILGSSGDVHYIDEVALTGNPNSTISRDTVNKRSGTASLKVTPISTGIVLAGTPDTGDGTGYSVVAGDWYYFRMYYRQAEGDMTIIVPTWLDNAGVPIKVGYDPNRSVADTPDNTFKLYTALWQAPVGATQLAITVGILTFNAAHVLNIDDVSLTRTGQITSSVLQSSSETSGDTSQAGTQMSIFLRASQSGYPYAEFTGHAFSRALHARLGTPVGAQNITSGAWTRVTLNTPIEYTMGVLSVAGNWHIIIPRNGYYNFAGQVNWSILLFSGTATSGVNAVAIERWSADGATFIERVCAQSVFMPNAYSLLTQNVSITARANRNERIYLTVYQAHTDTVQIAGSSGSIGIAHMLSVSYLGDAV